MAYEGHAHHRLNGDNGSGGIDLIGWLRAPGWRRPRKIYYRPPAHSGGSLISLEEEAQDSPPVDEFLKSDECDFPLPMRKCGANHCRGDKRHAWAQVGLFFCLMTARQSPIARGRESSTGEQSTDSANRPGGERGGARNASNATSRAPRTSRRKTTSGAGATPLPSRPIES